MHFCEYEEKRAASGDQDILQVITLLQFLYYYVPSYILNKSQQHMQNRLYAEL